MQYEQMLIFEVSKGCNLAGEHAGQCPISDPHRWDLVDTSRPMTDDLICECARTAYQEMGFVGHVAWHFYNEPLLEAERMWALMDRIKRENPQAKFYLFSNAILLPPDIEKARRFDAIWISNYHSDNLDWLRSGHPQCIVHDAVKLDNRLAKPVKADGHRCLRTYTEFVLDYYGNAHLCCMDWKGETGLPNVWQVGFREAFRQFVAMRDLVGTEPMTEAAPVLCRKCWWRGEPCPILLPIQHAAIEHVDGPDWWRKRPDSGIRLALEHPFMGRRGRILEVGRFGGDKGTLAQAHFETKWQAVMVGEWADGCKGLDWCVKNPRVVVLDQPPTSANVAAAMAAHGGPWDWQLVILVAGDESPAILAGLPLADMTGTEVISLEHAGKVDSCVATASPHGFRPTFLNKQFLILQRYQ